MMKKALLLVALTAIATTQTLHAEKTRPTDFAVNDSSRVVDLDAVVIVAQPKENARLRQQALSSSLFSSSDMLSLGVRDLRELSQYVPSLTMPNYGSRYTSAIYVRGIGARINSPSVGMYVDGMPLVSNSQYNSHLYGVERIDVLRGPQGTLYGMNSEGGLVRIYSRNPMNEQGTDVRLGTGTHGYRNIEAATYQKLSDAFALSVAGFYEGQNGFFRNVTTGERADKVDEAGGRLRLVWQPQQRLSFDYIADYQFTKQNGFPYGLLDTKTGLAAAPTTNEQGTYRRSMLNTALTAILHSSSFTLHSTTSFQHLHDNMLMDIDYTAANQMDMRQRQNQNALTEELVFKSNRKDSRWQWATGTFFSYRWLETVAPVTFKSDFNAAMQGRLNTMIPAMMQQAMIDKGMPAPAAQATVAAMKFNMHDLDMGTVPGLFKTPQMNLGFFHESNIAITDRLKATLGLRYDLSRQEIDYATSAQLLASVDMVVKGAPTTIPYNISSSLANRHHSTYNQLLPKIALTYDLDKDGSNLYATFSKGYRAGGYNIQNFSDIFQTQFAKEARSYSGGAPLVIDNSGNYEAILSTISYEPETSWNYEVGSHLNLFSHSLQLDVAAYYIQIRNQQLSQMASNYAFGRSMVNAGKSYSFGLELSARGRAMDNRLSYNFSYGFTQAKFTEYDDVVDGTAVSYKGKRVPYVPMHTLAAAADWRFDLQNSMLRSITLGANVAAQGNIYWNEANTRAQGFYATLGAHADFAFDSITLSLWGRNLTDKNYTAFAFQYGQSASAPFYAQRANPIQAGIDLRLHF